MEYKGIEFTKWFDTLTDEVLSVLAEGKFPIHDKERWDSFRKAVGSDRVIATIEFPYMDIELEMYTVYNDWHNANDEDDEIWLEYYVCTKNSEGDWESDDWALVNAEIDWASPDWETQLVEEMCETIEMYAESRGLSLTEPND